MTLITPYKSDVNFGDSFRDVVIVTDVFLTQVEKFSTSLWGNSESSVFEKFATFYTFWSEKTAQTDEVRPSKIS